MAWRIEEEGFDAARERQRESQFTIGNGYLGVRGAADTPPPGSQPDMFIAGIYDTNRGDHRYSEVEYLQAQCAGSPFVELVPLPFPFELRIAVDDEPLDFTGSRGRKLVRTLDLTSGLLRIESVYESSGGRRMSVSTRRCASLADPHLLLHDVSIRPDNHRAAVTLHSPLAQPDLALRHPHLQCVEHVADPDWELVRYTTRASGFEICIAARTWHEPLALRRLVSVFTSRDGPHPRAAALAHLQALARNRFDALLAANARAWASFWAKADVRVPGRPAVEQALRFASYHLRLPAGKDDRTSIGARALTGRAYQGHVFWDTEIFMLPFHLHIEPARARQLLAYRHRTLDGARRRARELGCRGACFPWESAVTGDDVTPIAIVHKSTGQQVPIFTGPQQLHVTADVAYAVWRYWDGTLDDEFLARSGAEILFETARFWTSRATPRGRQHHIRGVMGPDEYHCTVDDNAYTNWMARFNLERAAWAADRLCLHQAEAQEWSGLASSLYCPGPGADGVIEQFDGFFELGDASLVAQQHPKRSISRLLGWREINRLKLVKQADVLMLPLLFPDAFSDEIVAANYRYYEPLTDHGSSLSPPVHAAIAARIGLHEDARRYWNESQGFDLRRDQTNSMQGIHPGAMGATWMALVFGLLGVRFTDAGPQVDGRAARSLPPQWNSVELALEYRGRSHRLKVARP